MEAANEFDQLLDVIMNMQGLPRSNGILFLWFFKCFGEGNKPREKLVIPAHSDPNSYLVTAVRKASTKLSCITPCITFSHRKTLSKNTGKPNY